MLNVWSLTKFTISSNASLLVLMILFYMTVFKTKFKVNWAKLMFCCLAASSMHFVFERCKIMAFLAHWSCFSVVNLNNVLGFSDVFSDV